MRMVATTIYVHTVHMYVCMYIYVYSVFYWLMALPQVVATLG